MPTVSAVIGARADREADRRRERARVVALRAQHELLVAAARRGADDVGVADVAVGGRDERRRAAERRQRAARLAPASVSPNAAPGALAERGDDLAAGSSTAVSSGPTRPAPRHSVRGTDSSSSECSEATSSVVPARAARAALRRAAEPEDRAAAAARLRLAEREDDLRASPPARRCGSTLAGVQRRRAARRRRRSRARAAVVTRLARRIGGRLPLRARRRAQPAPPARTRRARLCETARASRTKGRAPDGSRRVGDG